MLVSRARASSFLITEERAFLLSKSTARAQKGGRRPHLSPHKMKGDVDFEIDFEN